MKSNENTTLNVKTPCSCRWPSTELFNNLTDSWLRTCFTVDYVLIVSVFLYWDKHKHRFQLKTKSKKIVLWRQFHKSISINRFKRLITISVVIHTLFRIATKHLFKLTSTHFMVFYLFTFVFFIAVVCILYLFFICVSLAKQVLLFNVVISETNLNIILLFHLCT